MKNKTIRKKKINKNTNKNKTKYITGGALSDYFAEIKKGLEEKCISETAVNDVNSIKKQLADLHYKINKMENKNNSECPDTCMREIKRLKTQINEIQLFLTNSKLKKLLNKNDTKNIDVLEKKPKKNAFVNFLFSQDESLENVIPVTQQIQIKEKTTPVVAPTGLAAASALAISKTKTRTEERVRELKEAQKIRLAKEASATTTAEKEKSSPVVAVAPAPAPVASPVPVAPPVAPPVVALAPVAPPVASPVPVAPPVVAVALADDAEQATGVEEHKEGEANATASNIVAQARKRASAEAQERAQKRALAEVEARKVPTLPAVPAVPAVLVAPATIQEYIPKIRTQIPITIKNIKNYQTENETLATALENIDNIDSLKEKTYTNLYEIVRNISTLIKNLESLKKFKTKNTHKYIDSKDLTELTRSIDKLKIKYSKININSLNNLTDIEKTNLNKVINNNKLGKGGYNKTIKNKKRAKTYRKLKKLKKTKKI